VDNAQRLRYLAAMGIDVWVPKFATQAGAVRHESVQTAQETFPDESASLGQNQQIADTWESLQAEVAACRLCSLCETRTHTVFGTGNPHADWLFIGEGPGQHEDEQGKPFVGKAGLLLTEMIRAMGMEREEVFITNIVKCRPPNNRDPQAYEIARCSGYLQRQIAFIKPKIMLAVGRIAAQTLLNTDAPLSKLRGRVHYLENTPVVVVYHPAFLLRSLLEKRKAWQDLQLAMRTLGE